MLRTTGLLLLALSLVPTLWAAPSKEVEPSAVMLRYPDVGPEHIVFRYAADLWLVPKAGGSAQRVTSAPGGESFPRFSPDGQRIAFLAGYDGGSEIYVMPSQGGVPKRLTWHPAQEILCGWTPDGQHILFSSDQASGLSRAPKFFTVPADGGPVRELPVPYGSFGDLDASGDWVVYTPTLREFRTWKRYQGGMAQDLWLFHLRTKESRRLTDWIGTDAQPMWFGAKVLFVSDRGADGILNLWSVDTESGASEQLTFFTDFGARFASGGASEVVFENGGKLYLYDVAQKALSTVDVAIPGDRPNLRSERRDVSSLVQSVASGPTGKRALVEARGELFDVPAKEGARRLLTGTSGIAERSPAWSPDGRYVAYFSDASGEYELTLRRVDGAAFEGSDASGERRLTELGPGFRYGTQWSPDSAKLSFSGHDGGLWIYHLDLADPAGGRLESIGTNPDGRPLAHSWSATSDWVVWSQRHSSSRLDALYLRDVAAGETHEVTSGRFDDSGPSFDPEGKYLYFTSSRTFEPIYGDLERTWIYANTRQLMAATLRADVAHPTAPKDPEEKITEDEITEEKVDDEKPTEEKTDDAPAGDTDESETEAEASGDGETKDEDAKKDETKAEDKPKSLAIDLAGFEGRIVELPVPPGNLFGAAGVTGGVLFLRRANTGAGRSGADTALERYDLEEREVKEVLSPVSTYEVAAKGDRVLVRSGQSWGFVAPKPGQKLEDKLLLDGLAVDIDPRAEWRQMLVETWRLFRDFFYEPTLHGLDWPAVLERYTAALVDATSREDLHFLTGEMMAELNVGHAYNRTPPGGLVDGKPATPVGLLGADFAVEQGAWRVQRIVGGEVGETDGRSPLAEPGVAVAVGDWILAVNGRAPATDRPLEASLEGLAGQVTRLVVNDAPTRDGGEREVLVTPLSSEAGLRYRAWVADRRAAVHRLSGGRVGYVHVPDTGVNGQTELVRQFYGERHRPALLVDERWNGGGQIPTRFIEMLNRPVTNYWAVRHGEDWTWPEMGHFGPKAMLINGWSGSGGDAFPFYFRQAGLGLLFGRRTWGGLVGISGNPQLVDGTGHAIPTFGFYETDGTWGIEGWGVEPDVEVMDDPTALANGGDPQLEAAVAHLLAELEAKPPSRPARPASPNRSGMGIDPKDR